MQAYITGYGDLVPVTHIGKAMAMLFALTCVPLYYMMVMIYSRHGLSITKGLVEKCTSDTRKAFLVSTYLMSNLKLILSLNCCINTTFATKLWKRVMCPA